MHTLLSPKNILVLETDNDQKDKIISWIEKLNNKCILVDSYKSLINYIKENKNIDLLIFDLEYDTDHCLSTIEQIRLLSINNFFPIIGTSFKKDPDLMDAFFEKSGNDYVVKPYSLNDLTRIHSHLINSFNKNIKDPSKCLVPQNDKNAFCEGNDILFDIDLNGKIISCSPSVENILGFKAKQLLNKFVKSYIPAYDLPKTEYALKKIEIGDKVIYETELIRHDNSLIPMEISLCPIYTNNTIIGAEGIARNIINRKKMINRLYKNELRLSTILDITSEGYMEFDENGKILDINLEMTSILGRSKNEILKHKLTDFMLEDKKHEIEAQFKKLKHGIHNTFEIDFIRPDYSYSHCIVKITPYINEKGDLINSFAMITDITEREIAKRKLAESEAKFRSIFNDSAIGIAILDENGVPIESNAALQKILGYTDEEFQNITFIELTDTEDAIKEMQQFLYLIAGEIDHYQLEKRYYRKDGEMIWCDLTVSLVRDADGCPKYAVGMIEDITKQKKAEIKIREHVNYIEKLSKLKDEFLAVASHDLRSPFSSILGFSEYLIDAPDISEDHKDLLKIIHKNAKIQLAYVDDLLSIIMLEGGKINLNINEANINDLLSNCIINFTILAKNKNITLTDEISLKSSVFLDETKVIQVVNNFLSNAIKFTPENGGITVKAFENNNQEIEVHVIDSGIGIPEKEANLVFNRYKKIRKKGTQGEKGTGLGLSISKKIIDLHGGTINVKSELNKGSDFYFVLPIKNSIKNEALLLANS